MTEQQLKCLEILEKLTVEIEKGLREKIEKELQEKIEKKLQEKFEKQLEEKLLEKRMAYERQLKEIEDEVMKKIENAFDGILHETKNLLAAAMKPVKELCKEVKPGAILEELPPNVLQEIANNLDPAAFMNWMQASKKLYSLAQTGNLRVPVELECLTFQHYNSSFDDYADDEEKNLMLLYKDKTISLKKLNSLNRMKCFLPKIKHINLENFPKCGERMRELFDYIGAKKIDLAVIEVEPNVEDLIKRYHIGELRLRNLTSTSFLYSPFIKRVRDLDLYFDENCDLSDVLNFLRSVSMHVAIYNPLPSSLFIELVQKWMNNQEHFTSIYFGIEGTRPYNDNLYNAVRSMLGDKYPKRFVAGEIRMLPIERVREIVVPLVPTLIVGGDKSLVAIREDLSMIRVSFFGHAASLNKMDEDEFAFFRSLVPVTE